MVYAAVPARGRGSVKDGRRKRGGIEMMWMERKVVSEAGGDLVHVLLVGVQSVLSVADAPCAKCAVFSNKVHG